MKKRIFTLLLACVLAAGTVAGPVGMETVQAEEKKTDDGLWEYEIEEEDDDGTSNNIVLTGYLGKEENVEIPKSIKIKGTDYDVTTLGGEWIFDDVSESMKGIVTITIPSSVTSIQGHGCFRGFSKLEKFVVDKDNPSYEADEAGLLYNKGKTKLICCPKTKQEVNIPDGVTEIGDFAFRNCSSLSSITIPNSVSQIDDFAFYGCSSLSSITIPNSVRGICVNAFYGCSSLVSMIIPDSVTYIGPLVFEDCSSLKDLYFAGGQEQWDRFWEIASDPWLGWGMAGKFKNVNEYLAIGEGVTVHLNSPVPENPQPGDIPQTPEQPQQPETPQTPEQPKQPETPQKSDQTITAKNITKTYGAKPFSLNASVNTGTALIYAVSDKKVATVDQKGKVTIKGCGITNITITAPGTDAYNQAEMTVKLTVKPKKVTLSSVKSTKKKTATVKWKKDKRASGYIIQCATDGKFKKNKVQMTVSKNKTVSATVKKLKAGKKYYVRVCAYAKSGKTKVQGSWSKVKTVKVKK